MRPFLLIVAAALVVGAHFAGNPALAKHDHDGAAVAPGLANVTLLVVRHAEKPADKGDKGLSPAGLARAKAYATYFQHFSVDGAPVHIDTLLASADSDESARPRLTLEPVGEATGLPIQRPFPNKQVKDVARWIAAGQSNDRTNGQTRGNMLIAWHHGKLVKLLEALGADPAQLLPDGIWPEDVYDWVIVLRYDATGRLSEAKRIVEPAGLE